MPSFANQTGHHIGVFDGNTWMCLTAVDADKDPQMQQRVAAYTKFANTVFDKTGLGPEHLELLNDIPAEKHRPPGSTYSTKDAPLALTDMQRSPDSPAVSNKRKFGDTLPPRLTSQEFCEKFDYKELSQC